MRRRISHFRTLRFSRYRSPHALPTPNVSALAGKQPLDLTATLDLNSIAYSQSPPSLAELLPPELAKAAAIPQFQNGTPAGEFVTFDMTFIEARWSDPGGKEVASARLGARGRSRWPGEAVPTKHLAKLAADSRATPRAGPRRPSTSSGVRLGMSFEDAEQAISKPT